MSLILDALKRSQQERDGVNDIPGIETQHSIDPLAPASGWRRSLPWVCLVVALAVIVWLVIDGKSKSNTPAAVIPAEIEEVLPTVEDPASTSAKVIPQVAQQPVAKVGQAVTINEDPAIDAKAAAKAAAVKDLYSKKSEEQHVVPEAAREPVPQQAEQAKAPAAEQVVTEQAVDIEKMIALAKVEAGNAALAEHSAPFLSELSQQLKDQIPTIYYSQHDYSSDSQRSSVTLNGEVLRAGSKIASDGLSVDEVLSSSVVLSYRDTQFRLKALNSWINL